MKQYSNFDHDFSLSHSRSKSGFWAGLFSSTSKVIISLSLFLVAIVLVFFYYTDFEIMTITSNKSGISHIKKSLALPLPAIKSQQPQTGLVKLKIKNKQKIKITDVTIKNKGSIDDYSNYNRQVEYLIKPGDSLAVIFKKHKLSKQLLHHIIYSSQHGKQLARIKPGQKIIFSFNKEEQLQSILLQKNKVESLEIKRNKSKNIFASTIIKKQLRKKQRFINVIIKDSLFLSAKKAGLSDNFTMELAQLFGWDIDFALEIRNGDSFSVLYNELYVGDEKIANGQILVAEFINQGKAYQSVYFTDKSGKSDYYSLDGYSKRKAFLRTPVAFSRISSRFSMGRRHPVLNRIRAHKGVDYASPRGTPIKAAGDGKISFKGRKGGYGRVVQIKHGSKYMTVYAHMSSFSKKIKRGSKVKQGQIIGYVGSSGLATGPHLHYEFRVNGVHRNPLKVTLPKANPINKRYLQSFLQYSENMISSLKLKKHKQIALLEH